MRPLYNLDDLTPEALALSQPYILIGLLGAVFWAVAYVLAIRAGFRERTYALPAAAICLNFGWEILTSFVFPNPFLPWRVLEVAWLLLDVVIVWQMFRFGPSEQADPELARRFRRYAVGAIVLGLVGQYAFVAQYQDALGFVTGFAINLSMSALFLFFYFARRHSGRGLSKGIAWSKMLGTVGTGIETYFLIHLIDPNLPSIGFFEFLVLAIFALDCLYIYYVHTRPGTAPQPAPAAA
jgi:hypothetical protein